MSLSEFLREPHKLLKMNDGCAEMFGFDSFVTYPLFLGGAQVENRSTFITCLDRRVNKSN